MRSLIFFAFLVFNINLNGQSSGLDALLQKHVNSKGFVNYKGVQKDVAQLDAYLSYLAKTDPSSWNKNKQKAFWMNAYNAYTIKLILDYYPLKSITDIKVNGKNAWELSFAKVGGKMYTLNAIEHEILRKNFNDPRIHVGINCASFSCPPILNRAFTESNVNTLLDKAFKSFVNDPLRNKLNQKTPQLSEIFNWFKDDFTKDGSLIHYLNKYAKVKIQEGAKIQYLKYDWSLNEAK